MRLSNSKEKTWRRCPKKYEFKYVYKLRPKRRQLTLERGSWLHELLMVHADGHDWEQRHKELTKQFYGLFEEEREDLGDLPTECFRIMKAYLRTWEIEDRQVRVVDTELDEIIELPNGLRFQIIVDKITEDKKTGNLIAWDYKTRKNFGDTDSMLLDPQLTRYFWGLQHMGYKPLVGVGYDEIRTKPPTMPQTLKSGDLSRAKNIDTDVYTYMSSLRRAGLDPADYQDILAHLARNQRGRFFRRTILPKDPPMVKTMMRELVYSAREIDRAEKRSEYPRTFIPNDCKWSCEFRDICIAQLHGSDISSMINADFEVSKRGEQS
jgi:hypothetical protein